MIARVIAAICRGAMRMSCLSATLRSVTVACLIPSRRPAMRTPPSVGHLLHLAETATAGRRLCAGRSAMAGCVRMTRSTADPLSVGACQLIGRGIILVIVAVKRESQREGRGKRVSR